MSFMFRAIVAVIALTISSVNAQSVYQTWCDQPLFNLSHGVFEPLSLSGIYEVGTAITFECRNGRTMLGSEYAHCQDNGQWEGIPACLEGCLPKQHKHGDLVPKLQMGEKVYQKGVTVRLVCSNDTRKFGPEDIVCQDNGTWNDNPTCEEFCDIILKPHMIVTPTIDMVHQVYRAGQSALFRCANEYRLVGVKSATCLGGNIWSNDIPTCEHQRVYYLPQFFEQGCGAPRFDEATGFYSPPPTSNGRYNVGAKITFRCYNGFVMYGSQYAYCQDNGEWNALPECSDGCYMGRIEYGKLSPELEQGKLTYRRGTTVHLTCNKNYRLLGSKEITCTRNGLWSSKATCAGVCDLVPKSQLHYLPKPSMPLGMYRAGQIVSFRCEKGHRLVGTDKSKCMGGNSWSVAIPKCTRIIIQCKPPVNTAGATYSPKQMNYQVEETITWTCPAGYTLQSKAVSTCSTHGKFLPMRPICKGKSSSTVKPGTYITSRKVCKRPRTILGCSLQPAKDFYPLNSEVVFKCSRGRYLVGIARATCRTRGFDDNLPKCQRIKCSQPRRPSNGEILNASKQTHYFGDQVRYFCKSDFVMYGPPISKCTANGQFYPGPPACRPPSCRRECKYVPGRSCQCDLFCEIRKDCCSDFRMQCRKLMY